MMKLNVFLWISCVLFCADIQAHNAKAIKGTNVLRNAKERQSMAERLPHLPTLEPTCSPAAMSCGVSRVKGLQAACERNLGGTTDFSVPLWMVRSIFFAIILVC